MAHNTLPPPRNAHHLYSTPARLSQQDFHLGEELLTPVAIEVLQSDPFVSHSLCARWWGLDTHMIHSIHHWGISGHRGSRDALDDNMEEGTLQ